MGLGTDSAVCPETSSVEKKLLAGGVTALLAPRASSMSAMRTDTWRVWGRMATRTVFALSRADTEAYSIPWS